MRVDVLGLGDDNVVLATVSLDVSVRAGALWADRSPVLPITRAGALLRLVAYLPDLECSVVLPVPYGCPTSLSVGDTVTLELAGPLVRFSST